MRVSCGLIRLGALGGALAVLAPVAGHAQCLILGDPSCLAVMSPLPSVIADPQTTGTVPESSIPALRGRRVVHNFTELHQRIRACWVPPSPYEIWRGMEYTVVLSFKRNGDLLGRPRITYATPTATPAARQAFKDAVSFLFDRCTPMPFSPDFGEAIAGRLIHYRFNEQRSH